MSPGESAHDTSGAPGSTVRLAATAVEAAAATGASSSSLPVELQLLQGTDISFHLDAARLNGWQSLSSQKTWKLCTPEAARFLSREAGSDRHVKHREHITAPQETQRPISSKAGQNFSTHWYLGLNNVDRLTTSSRTTASTEDTTNQQDQQTNVHTYLLARSLSLVPV